MLGGRTGGLLVTTNSNAQCTTRGSRGGVCWSGRSWYTELLLGTTFLVTATHAKNRGKGVERVVQMLSRLSGSTLFFFWGVLFFEECCRVVGKGGQRGVKGDGAGFRFSFYFSDQSKLTSGICCRWWWCAGTAPGKCAPFNKGSAKPEIPACRPPVAKASGNTGQV